MKINIDDKCMETYKGLKFDKAYRYIIFKIQNEQVVVEKTGHREQTWDKFLHQFPKDEYRFSVYDVEFKTNDGVNCSKIFFCTWLPEGAKIKIKMLYASAKESFRAYLDLNGKQINVSTVDEMNEEQLIKEFNK